MSDEDSDSEKVKRRHGTTKTNHQKGDAGDDDSKSNTREKVKLTHKTTKKTNHWKGDAGDDDGKSNDREKVKPKQNTRRSQRIVYSDSSTETDSQAEDWGL